MGMNNSGEIFFGVYFGEEDPRWPMDDDGISQPPEDDEEMDWEDWLAIQDGYVNPYDHPDVRDLSYDDFRAYLRDNKAFQELYDAWHEAKTNLVAICPVELIDVGDMEYGYSLYCLALTGSRFYNYGSPDPIPDNLFERASEERVAVAQQWCKAHGLNFDNPQWMLGASRG